MDEFKLVAEAIKTLGENGQTAFIWWVAKEIIIYLMGLLSWLGFLYTAWRLLSPLVDLNKIH